MLSIGNWGQDVMFDIYCKLYIGDIIDLREYEVQPSDKEWLHSKKHEGSLLPVFMYGSGRPVSRVDVCGVVVKVDRRQRCNMYTLDDGTGCIECTHWKNEEDRVQVDGLCDSLAMLAASLEDLQLAATDLGYSLGDFLHVRGQLKTYRSDKQISVNYINKPEEPGLFEVSRMFELPKLYENVYDKSPVIKQTENKQANKIKVLHKLIVDKISFCGSARVLVSELQSFAMHEIAEEEKQISVESKRIEHECEGQGKSMRQTNHEASEDRFSGLEKDVCWKAALQQVFDSGLLYSVTNNSDMVWVVQFDTHLVCSIKEILNYHSEMNPSFTNGCYYMHIYEQLRERRRFQKITVAVVLNVLQRMEDDSIIFSTSKKHYRLV